MKSIKPQILRRKYKCGECPEAYCDMPDLQYDDDITEFCPKRNMQDEGCDWEVEKVYQEKK